MKRTKLITVSLLLSFALFIMGACSPLLLTSSNTFNEGDLYSNKTFKIIQMQEILPKGVTRSDVDRLLSAVADEMKSRGYTEMKGNADMVVRVNYSVSLSRETNISGMATRTGYRRGVRGFTTGLVVSDRTMSTELIKDGVLTIDITNSYDNEHIFYAELMVDSEKTQLFFKDSKMLDKATDKLFKKFPIDK